MLAATALTVRYPDADRAALDGVSLQVRPGELVVAVGPNGSGKTTLQRAMLGLVPWAQGQVTLDGVGVDTLPRARLAGLVGALPQREEPAFPLRVGEAVLLGRWSRLGPLAAVRAEDRRAAEEAMQRCDLTALTDRPIETLSGGEWQRVRLARALTAAPTYLLLDEPTAALDIAHEMEVFSLLRDLAASGLGVLVITHQLALAARMADRALLLDRGVPVASGPPAEVFTEAHLSKVFQWPIAVQSIGGGPPLIVPVAADTRDALRRSDSSSPTKDAACP